MNTESWSSIERFDDPDGHVAKFVFKADDAIAEAVLYRYPDYETRTVICCSTQSGCPVGCRFCGAGDHFVRNLTAQEIVEQPAFLLERTGVDPASMGRLQIMFMSMGEPMLNWRALTQALRELHRRYPNAALLISTVGPFVPGAFAFLEDLSVEIPTIGLQFSVHESDNEARRKLIPHRHLMSLQEISIVGRSWHAKTGRKPFFNFCAQDHHTEADANRLRAMFHPDIWNATVSVVCERNEGLPATNPHQRELATTFAQHLVARGYDVRVFDPAGQDTIGGGCGQLWFVQNWMNEHPDLARPSVGHGMPEVHAPVA